MGIAFDQAPGRPDHIEAILNGLDRYNPETTTVFQDYVTAQCEERTYDCYANLALLKLYQFNPHLLHPDTTTAILVKALTVFPAPDFSLCLHLLPPHTLQSAHTNSTNDDGEGGNSNTNGTPSSTKPGGTVTNGDNKPSSGTTMTPLDPLSEAIQKLSTLNTLLESAAYSTFWTTLESDDLYADLVADVSGFEELMRVRIAVTVGQGCREIGRRVLAGWLGMDGSAEAFEGFVKGVCGWSIEGDTVKVPVNKENEAKGTVVREEVKFDQFGRVVRRAYEQPA